MNSISSDTRQTLLLDFHKSTKLSLETSEKRHAELTNPLASLRKESMSWLIVLDKQHCQPTLLPKSVGSLTVDNSIAVFAGSDAHNTPAPCHNQNALRNDALRTFGIGSKRKILKKICSRLTRGIDPDEWNSYRLIQVEHQRPRDRIGCMAIRFTGSNLVVLQQPAGLHTQPAYLNSVIGIHFRKTTSCPAQFLGIGEYLIWDDRCFTSMGAEQFHLIYSHSG